MDHVELHAADVLFTKRLTVHSKFILQPVKLRTQLQHQHNGCLHGCPECNTSTDQTLQESLRSWGGVCQAQQQPLVVSAETRSMWRFMQSDRRKSLSSQLLNFLTQTLNYVMQISLSGDGMFGNNSICSFRFCCLNMSSLLWVLFSLWPFCLWTGWEYLLPPTHPEGKTTSMNLKPLTRQTFICSSSRIPFSKKKKNWIVFVKGSAGRVVASHWTDLNETQSKHWMWMYQ